jgi:hypothetical protein
MPLMAWHLGIAQGDIIVDDGFLDQRRYDYSMSEFRRRVFKQGVNMATEICLDEDADFFVGKSRPQNNHLGACR